MAVKRIRKWCAVSSVFACRNIHSGFIFPTSVTQKMLLTHFSPYKKLSFWGLTKSLNELAGSPHVWHYWCHDESIVPFWSSRNILPIQPNAKQAVSLLIANVSTREVAIVEKILTCLVLLLLFFGFEGFVIVVGWMGIFAVVVGLVFFFVTYFSWFTKNRLV